MEKNEKESEPLEVISYSGYKADEHPVGIIWRGHRYKVLDWKFQGKIYERGFLIEKFWVKTEDEAEWEIALKEDGNWILLSRTIF